MYKQGLSNGICIISLCETLDVTILVSILAGDVYISNSKANEQAKEAIVMWAIILSIVMAILIGLIGDALVGHNMPGGILGSMIAGLVGAWIGSMLFGDFGPVIADFAVVPAIIGTAIFVFLLGLIGKLFRKAA